VTHLKDPQQTTQQDVYIFLSNQMSTFSWCQVKMNGVLLPNKMSGTTKHDETRPAPPSAFSDIQQHFRCTEPGESFLVVDPETQWIECEFWVRLYYIIK
jgi:hypothetical protein